MCNWFRTILQEVSKSFQSLSRTKELHALIITTQLLDPFYATKLVRLYSIHDDLISARDLFDRIPHRSVFLWNSIIRAYARVQRFGFAFSLFSHMLKSEASPDCFTYACLIRASSEKLDFFGLTSIHRAVITSGFGVDAICGSALVTAYSKLGHVEEASKIFHRIPKSDVVLWNCMISGYGHHGLWDKGIRLFNKMMQTGTQPDERTILGLITALVGRSTLRIGECVHGFCIKMGYDTIDFVTSALVSMYSRLGSMNHMLGVFNDLRQPDLVTWSALITGYSGCGDDKQALLLFKMMNIKGAIADGVLVSAVLSSCARMVYLCGGREIHGFVVRRGQDSNTRVSSALADTYSKCGSMDSSLRVFDAIPQKNIVSFNSVILGLGLHGLASQALEKFNEIMKTGMKPDESTFSALLSSCYHAGLVKEGQEIFTKMRREFGIEPRTEHYVYMVKLLGMSGELADAYDFVLSLPTADPGVWGALLSCSELRGDSYMAEVVARRLFHFQPKSFKYRVMLSNVYSEKGRWEDAATLREHYPGRPTKLPGMSWI